MKKTIAFFVTVAILLTLSVIETVYLDNVFNNLHKTAEDLYIAVANDPEFQNIDENLQKADKLLNDWQKARNIMLIVIPHIQVDEMTYRAVTLSENLKTRDYEMSVVSAAVLEKNFELMITHTKPCIRSII